MALKENTVLRSSLYECDVMHHRLVPRDHRFELRMFMFALDLGELDETARRVGGFARNRRAFYEFRDRDHLDLGQTDLRANLTAWLKASGMDLPQEARVLLVTLPRVLGYVFNPVSFYFCSLPDGSPLCAVAEVGNTFGEMKPYLIRPSDDGKFHMTVPKHFYVSPFSDLDLDFEFRLRTPDERLALHVNVLRAGQPVVVTSLTGRQLPLTTLQLARLSLWCPLVTLKVITLIHWHALLLWLKGIPFHRKEAEPELQQNVLRPHVSIAGKTS